MCVCVCVCVRACVHACVLTCNVDVSCREQLFHILSAKPVPLFLM